MPYIEEKCPVCGRLIYVTFLDVGHATKYCPKCDNEFIAAQVEKDRAYWKEKYERSL